MLAELSRTFQKEKKKIFRTISHIRGYTGPEDNILRDLKTSRHSNQLTNQTEAPECYHLQMDRSYNSWHLSLLLSDFQTPYWNEQRLQRLYPSLCYGHLHLGTAEPGLSLCTKLQALKKDTQGVQEGRLVLEKLEGPLKNQTNCLTVHHVGPRILLLRGVMSIATGPWEPG